MNVQICIPVGFTTTRKPSVMTEYEFKRQSAPLVQSVVSRNRLNLDESCSWETEQQRTEIAVRMISYIKSLDLTNPTIVVPMQTRVLAFLKELSEVSGNLCNTYKAYACNKNTLTCDCAVLTKTQFGFDAHSTREGNGECRLPAGSMCTPTVSPSDGAVELGIPKTELQCSASATCLVQANGVSCTMHNVVVEIRRILRNEYVHPSNLLNFVTEKLENGLCKCQTSSISSTSGLN